MTNNTNGSFELSDETLLVHDERYSQGAISPPIYQSSLFSFESYEAMLARFSGETDSALYSRVDNPTVKVLQEKIALLERADAAVAFGSGMAAISNAVLSVVKTGDKILCINHVYPDTYRFICGLCSDLGISAEFVDGTDIEAIESKLEGVKLLYLESPNSWMMEEQNLRAISVLAKKYGVTTIIDNSWATPLFQKPITLGIDLVVHSASKYISGHSDTVAGVVAGRQDLIDQMTRRVSPFLGGKLSAKEAWLLIRGMRTLPLRMKRHHDSGMEIAKKLAEHSNVTEVFHPGLTGTSYDQLTGFGSLFSFELDKSIEIPTFCNALNLFRMGVSWGGYESLVIPASAVVNQVGDFNSAQDFGVSANIIRLFVGLEDPSDLWKDLSNALNVAHVKPE